MRMMVDVPFSDLMGKTMRRVEMFGDDEIVFEDVDGTMYKLYHQQECCETVTVEDISGDLSDLVGTPILMAEEISGYSASEQSRVQHALMATKPRDEDDESFTLTFYKLATIKGYVDIRWYGVSNGNYSESVSFSKLVDRI